MPQTQQPSTHAAPPPSRSPRRCFSSGCFRQPPPSNRDPSTNPIRTTPPSRTKQASSPRAPSASLTGSSRISADRIYSADSRALSTTKGHSLGRTNYPVIFAKHFRPGFSGRPSWTLSADQPGLGDQPSMPVKTYEPPFGSPSSYDFSLTTSSRKGPRTKPVVAVPTIDMSQVLRRAARSPSRTPTRNPRQRL